MVREVLAYSPVLCGLASNPALPVDLLDRCIAVADAQLCVDLADRDDLSLAQVRRLAAYGGVDTVVRLVRRGLLSATDLDNPDPQVVLALLDVTEAPEPWTRALSAHPDPAVRAELAPDERVAEAAAANPSLSHQSMEDLTSTPPAMRSGRQPPS